MPIVVTDSLGASSQSDTYPTHVSNLGKGGVHSYPLLSDRNNISNDRRDWGMICVVYNDTSYNGIYQLVYGYKNTTLSDNGNWAPFAPPNRAYEGDLVGTKTLEAFLGEANPISCICSFYIKSLPTISGKVRLSVQSTPFSNLFLIETFSPYISGTKDTSGTLNIFFEDSTIKFQNNLDPASSVYLGTNLKLVLVREA